ncbi:Cobalt/zinc/cadmium efflux RND transporter, membrane fusion protein, CzcB family [Leptospirillum ferriphilum]|uniref:Cobalt/zinc/cadmium efflux RND transporter, membrane fusion protein, CzcB family n=1 Tax=Leptospirillum ferriphilum TaxID=178606 RepID=A0A094X540_9BACT|nr:efflux RND transporter periplasmic adaptor subunit [Leptospirillum ferriphilum]KGA93684.1 Cobalt/zinc/cadmium efflux RND transporter, membrane fusion protein, CzcB family [Leptospirillum ferriphilum]
MNRKLFVSISLALSLGMGIGAGAIRWMDASNTSTPKKYRNMKGKPERKILYWRNPMNPSIRADHPMKDNMGMDYIPVYAEPSASSGKSVSVDSGIRQTLGVRIAPVVKRTFARTIRTAATVTFDEHRIRVITTRFSGWIRNLSVLSTGDPVRKGDIIAWIYSPELASSEAEAQIALQALNSNPSWPDNQKIWDAAQERLRLLGVPDTEIARLKQTGKPRSVIPVHSPYSGVVTSISARIGGAVSPEKPLMTLADTTRVWVDVFLYSPDLAWVKAGDPVILHPPSMASRHYKGTLRFVNPEVEKTSRTFRARVDVRNPDGFLKVGMYLEAILRPDPHPNALVIPREALIRTGKKTVVITEVGQGRFRPVRVTVGARSPHWIEVSSGLQEGERVVVSGQFLLDAESRFENVSDRMDEGGHP